MAGTMPGEVGNPDAQPVLIRPVYNGYVVGKLRAEGIGVFSEYIASTLDEALAEARTMLSE